MGGLRRPNRPFPVACVLAVDLLPAAISQQFGPIECAGPRPVPAEINLVALGERLNANSILSAIQRDCLPVTTGASRNPSMSTILQCASAND